MVLNVIGLMSTIVKFKFVEESERKNLCKESIRIRKKYNNLVMEVMSDENRINERL